MDKSEPPSTARAKSLFRIGRNSRGNWVGRPGSKRPLRRLVRGPHRSGEIRDVRERQPAAGRDHGRRHSRARHECAAPRPESLARRPACSTRTRRLVNRNGVSHEPDPNHSSRQTQCRADYRTGALLETHKRIIVTGANSAEAVIDLHRLGYARATTTSNCGLPAGQYEVVLLDGRQRSIKAIETTLDWVADFLSRTGVLIVWLDPLQPATSRPLRTVLEGRGFRIEVGTVHERGSAVAARRCELKPISKVA